MNVLDFDSLPLIACVSSDHWRAIESTLGMIPCFIADGNSGDFAVVFRQVAASFPLDPPLSGKVNWDALADSLIAGLTSLNRSRVFIVISGVHSLASLDLENLLKMTDTLLDVARTVCDVKLTTGTRVDVRILYVGRGPSFR